MHESLKKFRTRIRRRRYTTLTCVQRSRHLSEDALPQHWSFALSIRAMGVVSFFLEFGLLRKHCHNGSWTWEIPYYIHKSYSHLITFTQLITCDNYFTLFKSYWAMCAQLVIIFTFPDLNALVIQLDMAKVFISQMLQPGLHTGLTKEDNGFINNRLLQSHLTMNWCALWAKRLLSTLDSSLLIHIIASFFSPANPHHSIIFLTMLLGSLKVDSSFAAATVDFCSSPSSLYNFIKFRIYQHSE